MQRINAVSDILVSAIIPYYRREDVIERAIQSLEPIAAIDEIIVVDDELSARSGFVLDQVSVRYSKVRIVKNLKIKGALSARIEGSLASTNELLLFLDSDDQCMAQGVQNCLKHLAENPNLAIVYGNVLFAEGDRQSHFLRLNGHQFDIILKNLSLCPFSGLCARKSLVPWGNLIRNIPAWQDDDFTLSSSQNNDILFVDCVTAKIYNGGADRISTNKNKQLIGLRMLLEKWGHFIIERHGRKRLFLWKLRLLSLEMATWKIGLEAKNRSSFRVVYSPVIVFLIISINLAQKALRMIFARYFDRVYA
jgi:glycosyltransferase involved in cell wall biosynthesis